MHKTVRNSDIDIGLSALFLHAKPGQTLSCAEIAKVCGCSRESIAIIEIKALKKLRKRIDLKQHLEG